ncbi:tyrosine-type recombinase/integrase [Cognatilysobacter bugurensis]|uniref:DUF4102 domain-containing protein n=1 Tax=Cognatilysobacter bugurensis TaxID=543356 RepID=A0A918SUG1_9GAMM|nr:DUF4102 domain-containing protein [Lysobacter bugurensis]GHA71334.1 hypothetical protein GCM10007067_04560 [Lysobacter bugurensis]
MPLTDTAARNAKPRAKPYKLTDGAGLYLEVMPTGARYWRMRYRHGGRDSRVAFGVYPEVTLAEARKRREEARAALREGQDPAAVKRARKTAARVSGADSFKAIADEWLAKQAASLAPVTYAKAQWMLGLVPGLHALPIAQIGPPDVLMALRPLEAAGTLETAHRVKQRIGKCSAMRSPPDVPRSTRRPPCAVRWPPSSLARMRP